MRAAGPRKVRTMDRTVPDRVTGLIYVDVDF
jgi:hypothetical protein